MRSSRLGGLRGWLSAALATGALGEAPRATVQNGTYVGKHIPSYNQDLFLGIPFAQPPVGELRYQNPQSLDEAFGVRQATEYADSCVGYGNSNAWPFTLSEDCLTLNVVRPAGYAEDAGLPVGVFIHGGGWTMDYSANGVYNLSFIVEQSVKIDKPIIAISLDYRLSAWGFLASEELVEAGLANLGLKDQRLALHWVRENVAAFGGDPSRVVIWGESAGGGSVGYHATAFGGRDDGLFRGAIAESGADSSPARNLTGPGRGFDGVVRGVGCGGDKDSDDRARHRRDLADKLDCLRRVPFAQLNETIVSVSAQQASGGGGGYFRPVVDGGIISDLSSTLLAGGRFTRTPLLVGTNADEGAGFVGASAVETDEDVAALLGDGVDAPTRATLLALYPDIDALGLPARYRAAGASPPLGAQYKRAVALATDQAFLSWRRLRTDAWSRAKVPVYSYLFDSPSGELDNPSGTPHFAEIGYVFHNTEGVGYAEGANPLAGASEAALDLARLMSRMWVSFIHGLDPNGHGVSNVAKWPVYNGTGGYGENYFFTPGGSRAEPDTFRLAGTSFMNSVAGEQYDR